MSLPLTWLVTGTSNGLGLALAQYVLRQKHNLVSLSRYAQPHESLPPLAKESGASLNHIQLDLATPEATKVKSAITNFLSSNPSTRISVLVNMAAISTFGPLETTKPESVDRVMHVNYFSPLYIIQALLPHMRANAKSTSSWIINVSSTQGLTSDPGEFVYDSSKHALEAMSESLAAEVRPFGIQTVIVEPGAFRTNLAAAAEFDREIADAYTTLPDGSAHPVKHRLDLVAKYGAGFAPGDPVKAAKVTFDMVTRQGETGRLFQAKTGEAALERLILGPDAWKKLDEKIDSLRANVDAVKSVAHSTDLDADKK